MAEQFNASYEMPFHDHLHYIRPFLRLQQGEGGRAALRKPGARLNPPKDVKQLEKVVAAVSSNPAQSSSAALSGQCDQSLQSDDLQFSSKEELEVLLPPFVPRDGEQVNFERTRIITNLIDKYELAPFPNHLVSQILDDEEEFAQQRRIWDTASGSCLDLFDSSASLELRVAYIAGQHMDCIGLGQISAEGRTTASARIPLASGRKILQLRTATIQGEHYLATRGMYTLNFLGATSLAPDAVASGCAGLPDLRLLGATSYASRPLHVCLNPQLRGEAACILESGHLVLSRIGHSALESGGVQPTTADVAVPDVSSSRFAPRLPWHCPFSKWRPPRSPAAHWGSAEYSTHPRVLLAANPWVLCRSDLRAPQRSSAALLFDIRDHVQLSPGLFSALAVPPASACAAAGGPAGPIVALASDNELVVLDLRCLRTPHSHFKFGPDATYGASPRCFVHVTADGSGVMLLERHTGRLLHASLNGGPPKGVIGAAAGYTHVDVEHAAPPLPLSLDPQQALVRALHAHETRCPAAVFPLAGCAVTAEREPRILAMKACGDVFSYTPQLRLPMAGRTERAEPALSRHAAEGADGREASSSGSIVVRAERRARSRTRLTAPAKLDTLLERLEKQSLVPGTAVAADTAATAPNDASSGATAAATSEAAATSAAPAVAPFKVSMEDYVYTADAARAAAAALAADAAADPATSSTESTRPTADGASAAAPAAADAQAPEAQPKAVAQKNMVVCPSNLERMRAQWGKWLESALEQDRIGAEAHSKRRWSTTGTPGVAKHCRRGVNGVASARAPLRTAPNPRTSVSRFASLGGSSRLSRPGGPPSKRRKSSGFL